MTKLNNMATAIKAIPTLYGEDAIKTMALAEGSVRSYV